MLHISSSKQLIAKRLSSGLWWHINSHNRYVHACDKQTDRQTHAHCTHYMHKNLHTRNDLDEPSVLKLDRTVHVVNHHIVNCYAYIAGIAI